MQPKWLRTLLTAIIDHYYTHATSCTLISEITCPKIQLDEDWNVKFITDGVIVGSHVTYTCVIGYKRSAGDATCECLVNGTWSCGPPTCRRE